MTAVVAVLVLALASIDSYAREALRVLPATATTVLGVTLVFHAIRAAHRQALSRLQIVAVIATLPALCATLWVTIWILIGGVVYFTSRDSREVRTVATDIYKVRGRTCVQFYYAHLDRLIAPCGKLYGESVPKILEPIIVHAKEGPLGSTVFRIAPELRRSIPRR